MWFRELRRRLAHLFRRDEFTRDLKEEIGLHLEMRARKLQDAGIPASDAGWAARRSFGNLAAVQDASAGQWGWTSWERLAQDLRIGARALRKTPGFTTVAVLTLALGLGMNTAVFSVVNAVMVQGLPYPEPQRLVSLWEEVKRPSLDGFNSTGAVLGGKSVAKRTTVSVANLVDYRAQCPAFAGLAGYDLKQMNLTENGEPRRLTGEIVNANFFSVLGVKPALGREFLPEEEPEGAPAVVIVTHDFWQRQLGGDTDVLGRTLMLDARPYRIVGVLPADFESPAQLALPDRLQFYLPPAFPPELLQQRGDHEVNVVGRLAAGASIETARAQLDAVNANLARQFPKTNANFQAVLAPLRDDVVRNVKDSLVTLLGASGLIVLITCVNVANLLLVRAVARRHETSVRLALGASRLRVIRQFLAESVLVAAAGAIAGILLGRAMMRAVLSLAPANIPRIHSVAMDWRVFALAAAIATITGLVFGLAPAWQASDAKPAESLKNTARAFGGHSQVQWRAALTVAEVALSMILLVGAGLLLKSFVLLMGVDLGFQPDRVLAMNIALPDLRYKSADDRFRFYQQLEERVRALPGVEAVAFANRLPLRGGWSTGARIDTAPTVSLTPDAQAVNPGYFETLGIALLHGRLLTPMDRPGQPPVIVVNQAFSRQYLNGGDPVGHLIARGPNAPKMRIVGVVADIRRGGKEEEVKPGIYISAAQTDLYPVRLGDLAVRTSGDPRRLLKAIQSQVWSLDKDLPVTNVRTLEEIVDASVAQRRFQTTLLLIFAAVAVALAVIGVFGVLSYAVNQRTAEIGIRVALGAEPSRILGMVLKQAGAMIGIGVAIGLAGAFALTRYLQSMLFTVKPNDWRAFAAAGAMLAAVSLLAALVPARRGSKVDPIVALRYE
jgi:putative ABC transport system permease protein